MKGTILIFITQNARTLKLFYFPNFLKKVNARKKRTCIINLMKDNIGLAHRIRNTLQIIFTESVKIFYFLTISWKDAKYVIWRIKIEQWRSNVMFLEWMCELNKTVTATINLNFDWNRNLYIDETKNID